MLTVPVEASEQECGTCHLAEPLEDGTGHFCRAFGDPANETAHLRKWGNGLLRLKACRKAEHTTRYNGGLHEHEDRVGLWLWVMIVAVVVGALSFVGSAKLEAAAADRVAEQAQQVRQTMSGRRP